MAELQEYFLLKQGKGGSWFEITKSYESSSLIQAGKDLSKQYPDINFGVRDKEGTFLWQGKGTPQEVPATDE